MTREKCRKNYNIKMCVSTFSSGKFKYLGKTLTNYNYSHEEMNRNLKSGHSCHRSVQVSFCVFPIFFSRISRLKSTKFLFVCVSETWSHTLEKKRRLGVFCDKEDTWDRSKRDWTGLYSSPSITRAIKASGMILEEYVARVRGRWRICRILLDKTE